MENLRLPSLFWQQFAEIINIFIQPTTRLSRMIGKDDDVDSENHWPSHTAQCCEI